LVNPRDPVGPIATNAIYSSSRAVNFHRYNRRAFQEIFAKKIFGRGDVMIVGGLLGVMVGGVAAYAAERYPAYLAALETISGMLVLGGFAVAGYALSTFVIV
jgi:hypothetical protein